MGFTGSLLAVSSEGVPREDVLTADEAGRPDAELLVEALFGDAFGYERQALWHEIVPFDDSLWVGVFGDDTVLFSGDHALLDAIAQQLQQQFITWRLTTHSVNDLCEYAVTGGPYDGRRVQLFDGMGTGVADACTGPLMPFEVPYFTGQHSDPEYPLGFHPLELAGAALVWIFGIEAETPPADEIITPLIAQVRQRPAPQLHRFRLC